MSRFHLWVRPHRDGSQLMAFWCRPIVVDAYTLAGKRSAVTRRGRKPSHMSKPPRHLERGRWALDIEVHRTFWPRIAVLKKNQTIRSNFKLLRFCQYAHWTWLADVVVTVWTPGLRFPSRQVRCQVIFSRGYLG